MCNLYSVTTNQAAIIALFRVINRYVGNLPPMPGVFPDIAKRARSRGPAGHFLMSLNRMPVAWTDPHGASLEWIASDGAAA